MERFDTPEPVDAHVHVWDRSLLRLDWLDDLPELATSRLPWAYDAQRGKVGAAVFVQAGARPADALAEATWVQSLAQGWPALAGIVADADLLSPPVELGAHLDALEELPLYRGVRHLLQDLDVQVLRSDALLLGLDALARRDSSFDACVRWWQLEELAGLLERSSPLTVVLDHIGKPPLDSDVKSEAWAGWEVGLRRIGALPGAHVKLSGLSAEMSAGAKAGPTFRARAAHAIETALDVFGAERAMFGSDWPVSAVGGAGLSTAEWLDFVRGQVSDVEWLEIGSGTAARVYRLER
ncbi:amidohydrolase [Pseudoclavibacter sp. RFBB5]|uniref:amidohydrolase family protein n=1 Tax=Pseudoclavibacter sp. RFBB5 TaxID=2080574 RepID=UPI0015E205A3|nr:amidohydrolase family protein [Pseudoclavibacter sp. RFBB5]